MFGWLFRRKRNGRVPRASDIDRETGPAQDPQDMASEWEEDVKAASQALKQSDVLDGVEHGDIERVRRGLNAGAQADVRFGPSADFMLEGRSALDVALFGDHLAIAQLLVEAGAPVNETDNEGHSLLYKAASEGDVSITLWLLERGADPNQYAVPIPGDYPADPYERPIYPALKHGHFEIAEALLAAGTNLEQTDDDGKTLLQHFQSLAQNTTEIIDAPDSDGFGVPTVIENDPDPAVLKAMEWLRSKGAA